MRYELASTVESHSGDVKAVAFTAQSQIVTAGRDGSATLTPPGTAIYSAEAFVNAATVLGSTIYLGAQDGTIVAIDIESGEERYFMGHSDNVSSLAVDMNTGLLASSSWDYTARLWRDPTSYVELRGHKHFVWDIVFAGADHVITASADKTLALWTTSGALIRKFEGHTDVVRGVTALPNNQFASVSNDLSVRIWNLDGSKVSVWPDAHSSFIYSIAFFEPEGLLFTSGEDRSVRIWKLDGRTVQVVTLPAVSAWKVAVGPSGDFAVGSSDHCARVFTRSPERQASVEARAEFETAVAKMGLGEDQAAIDESQVSDASALDTPGAHEGQTKMIRRSKGVGAVEVWQYGGDRWAKIGEVVGSSSDGGKISFEGKNYDYVFDVDIKDNAPPLRLPFNRTDNVYDTADWFIERHMLAPSYREQIVQFLISNTQSHSIGGSAATPTAAVSHDTDVPRKKTVADHGRDVNEDILKFNETLAMKSFQAEPLVRAFTKAATDEKAEIPDVEAYLAALPGSADALVSVALPAVENWEVLCKLPALDLLRIAVVDATKLPDLPLYVALIGCLDPGVPKHALLATRGFSNLLARSDGRSILTKQKSMYRQALTMLASFGSENVQPPMAVAAATLALNLVVLDFDDSGSLAAVGRWLTPCVKSDPRYAEARYRLGLAIGIRLSRFPSDRAGTFSSIAPLYEGAGEPRFVELAKAVRPLFT